MVNYSLSDPQGIHFYQPTDSSIYRLGHIYFTSLCTFLAYYQEERTYHGCYKKSMDIYSKNEISYRRIRKNHVSGSLKKRICCSPRKLFIDDAGGRKINHLGSDCNTNPCKKRKKWRFNGTNHQTISYPWIKSLCGWLLRINRLNQLWNFRFSNHHNNEQRWCKKN